MSTKLYDAFCENVRARMSELGMRQADLAKRLNVDKSYVSQILNGHRRPGLDSLEDFANALEIEPSDLLKTFSRSA